jgi:hypothetical protein
MPIKVQLGLFGDVAKWQREVEKLSELFDTDDEESLHYILQGGLAVCTGSGWGRVGVGFRHVLGKVRVGIR